MDNVFVKVIEEEFLCMWDNLAIPIEARSGEHSPKSPINVGEAKKVIDIAYQRPYIIFLTGTSIEIFDF